MCVVIGMVRLPAMPQSSLRQKVRALGRLRTNEHTTMTLLAVFVGLLGGYGAVGFRYLIGFFQELAYGGGGELLDLALATPWYLRWVVPAAGGLVVGPIVYFLANEAKGHGEQQSGGEDQRGSGAAEVHQLRRGSVRNSRSEPPARVRATQAK